MFCERAENRHRGEEENKREYPSVCSRHIVVEFLFSVCLSDVWETDWNGRWGREERRKKEEEVMKRKVKGKEKEKKEGERR